MMDKEEEKLAREYLGIIRRNPQLVSMVHRMHKLVRERDELSHKVWQLSEEIDDSDAFFDRFTKLHDQVPPHQHTINGEHWHEYFKVDEPTVDDFLKNLARFCAMSERQAVEAEERRREAEAKRSRLQGVSTEDLQEELKRRGG